MLASGAGNSASSSSPSPSTSEASGQQTIMLHLDPLPNSPHDTLSIHDALYDWLTHEHAHRSRSNPHSVNSTAKRGGDDASSSPNSADVAPPVSAQDISPEASPVSSPLTGRECGIASRGNVVDLTKSVSTSRNVVKVRLYHNSRDRLNRQISAWIFSGHVVVMSVQLIRYRCRGDLFRISSTAVGKFPGHEPW